MPRIFDNIDNALLPALRETLLVSQRADFCVGYFNLRGWKCIDTLIDSWSGGEGSCCRLLVGMQRLPEDDLRAGLSLGESDDELDQGTVLRLKKRMAEEFRQQLMLGAPSNGDETGLRRLSAQLHAGKVVVKLHLRHTLHAKLYLVHRVDPITPTTGFLGSSNLTLAGLRQQGELNVDVLDHDACQKLQRWFNDRWADRWCLDISAELAGVIDASWAREEALPPYHIYLKIAYHLSQEARAGLAEFQIPRDLRERLFPFQAAAVKIAAHHLNKRNGVLIGDVVGLGKTLMATALARIFEDDYGFSTLIICPKNLVSMWQEYVNTYGLRALIMSTSRVIQDLPKVPARYRLVLIDESHNLRNREGKRYRAIHDYIEQSGSKTILLSATPYNKTYLDLSAQLRLFVPPDSDLGIRPEQQLRHTGETEFIRRHQCGVRSLAAFEHSEYPDDWRELMRLYMVRRTRGFVRDNYAETDTQNQRRYLTFADGSRSYFPTREPRTVPITIDDGDASDPYAVLYSAVVVDAINMLSLPRYGLGNYVAPHPESPPTDPEAEVIKGLGRAGKRLMGFCRTNLFKRLESGGPAFLQSIQRHILRNYVVLHALEHNLHLPLGTQDADLLDAASYDEDADGTMPDMFGEDGEGAEMQQDLVSGSLRTEEDYVRRAAEVYTLYADTYRRRFKWLPPTLFVGALATDLRRDARALLGVLVRCGTWDVARDAKLTALLRLLNERHPHAKVLVFTQFADTVRYLTAELKRLGVTGIEGATGDSADPTAIARRFSPTSNSMQTGPAVPIKDELRVLVATDVLSEGQNLQDCAIIVNYDLPWAIIRLIQRAGRVDRIGQQSDTILCYSFLPADGVERIIRLRSRVSQRLLQNAEVVGTDEAFFEDDSAAGPILDLYNEKAGILDGDADTEVDLGSYAYQIWKNAIDQSPSLERAIADLPNVVYSTRAHAGTPAQPDGVLVYMRTADDNDALAWIDREGRSVTQSQLAILRAAECGPGTPAQPRHAEHHDLVKQGVSYLVEEERVVGGQLGRPSGARFRTYERLKHYADSMQGTLFAASASLLKAIDEIYRYPLHQSTTDALNRQLRSGIGDAALAELVVALRDDNRLCRVEGEAESREPQIICSMGLFAAQGDR